MHAGIQTSQDARFYALSRKFKPFSNKDKTLVIQFTVKHEQNIDCGGGYVKIFDCSLDQKDMHGDTPYEIMFGKNFQLFQCYFYYRNPSLESPVMSSYGMLVLMDLGEQILAYALNIVIIHISGTRKETLTLSLIRH